MITFPIHHWRFEDGKTCPNEGSPFPMEPPPYGWYCWAYATRVKDFDLDDWMKVHMTGKYDCTLRFNSGNPMFTIWIAEEKDAMFFQLTFGNGND